jgi:hypothetical protein
MMEREPQYPVHGRSELRNRRIAAHEVGHAFVGRCLGSFIHNVTIIPDRGTNGYEGRRTRSAQPSSLDLTDVPALETEQILSICERLERFTPEIGSTRVESSEYLVRSQINITELVAGQCAELILHPELPSLGATHDFVEAAAFGRITVAAQSAVAALLKYCEAEASSLILEHIVIVRALVEALIERGTLSGDQVDEIISQSVAARLIKIEHQRRDDWRTRERSAAKFLEGIGKQPFPEGF